METGDDSTGTRDQAKYYYLTLILAARKSRTLVILGRHRGAHDTLPGCQGYWGKTHPETREWNSCLAYLTSRNVSIGTI